jgi:acetyl-CoA synthase
MWCLAVLYLRSHRLRDEIWRLEKVSETRRQKKLERFTIYSLMDAPLTTCGCCECVMMLVPEANGIMIVSRDDNSMTPCGMTFTTCMGTVGGGQQTPGMMGHSKRWVLSKKFIPYEGGIKRVVWLSKNIKEEL